MRHHMRNAMELILYRGITLLVYTLKSLLCHITNDTQVLFYLETFSTIVSPVNDYYNSKCDYTMDTSSAITRMIKMYIYIYIYDRRHMTFIL